MIVWRWLVTGLLILLCLVACTAVPDPTPTPVQNVAVVATLVVERPSATPIPSLTPTPLPTTTSEPTSTSTVLPASTTIPSPTIIPSPTPDPGLSAVVVGEEHSISDVMVSSLGQLAFIQDGVLRVETAVGAGEFEEIGRYAQAAAWSPDGGLIAYSLADRHIIFDYSAVLDAAFVQRVWSVEDGSDVSFSELVANYPSPHYHVTNLFSPSLFWSPDGTKILLQAALDERYEEARLLQNDYLLVTADLNEAILSDPLFISTKSWPVWFTDEIYVLRHHCGAPCASFSAASYSGRGVWGLQGGSTTGWVDFALSGNFMIIAGRTDVPDYQPTIEEVSLVTGEAKALWSRKASGDFFSPFFMPVISPNEEFISFNYGGDYGVVSTLYVIDRNGQEFIQILNSFILDWRPNSDLMINKILESGANQLVYLTLAGELEVIFTTEVGTVITDNSWSVGGKWSPDGRFFTFTTENRETNIRQLYLWLPEHDEVRLILTEDGDLRNLTWLPDSNAFYFTSSTGSQMVNDIIWRYEVEMAD